MTMFPNSVLLKRSLKALGMKGTTLAERLTSYRDDEKTTSPATISRWVSGAVPVEPAVMAWLEMLVREKAQKAIGPYIKMPARNSLVIYVASPSGGAGVSTVAQALAVIAKQDFRANLLHLCVVDRCDSEARVRAMQALRIESQILSIEEMASFKPKPGQVVIADIGRDVIFESYRPDQSSILRSDGYDVMLVPTDFDSRMQIRNLQMFIEQTAPSGPLKLLNLTNRASLRAASYAHQFGFDFTSRIFHDELIVQALDDDFLPSMPISGWRDDYQHRSYSYLFSELVSTTGGAAVEREHAAMDVKNASLPQLLDILESREA